MINLKRRNSDLTAMILIHFKVQLDEYHSVKRDFKNCIRKLGDQQILILKLLTKNVEKFTEV